MTIEHLLKDILHEESRRTVTIDLIQRKVAEHFDVRLADMTSKRRPQNIAFPRQIAMYLARELTKTSLAEIGDAFGGRDHGTVLHAHRLVPGAHAERRQTAPDGFVSRLAVESLRGWENSKFEIRTERSDIERPFSFQIIRSNSKEVRRASGL